MHPDEAPRVIEVRHKTGWKVFLTVFGSMTILAALVFAMLPGSENLFAMFFAGGLMLILGIVSFSKPYCSFETSTRTLYLHGVVGKRAVRAERIYFDGADIKLVTPNGKERKVNLRMMGNADDLDRLERALTPTRPPQETGRE